MSRTKSLLLWVFALLFTLAFAVYQRMTGPTYPLSGKAAINNEIIRYKLPRTHAGAGDDTVRIQVPSKAYTGRMIFVRYKSFDTWANVSMRREGDYLAAEIPHQPIAGKIMYNIYLKKDNQPETPLVQQPVIMRFRGDVPAYIIIPHVILIFIAMWFSTRTGLEVLFKGDKVLQLTKWTAILFFVGGLIMGPLMQWFAFEAFWTGWPFGHDLTDNKSLVALIMWIIAYFIIRKNPAKKGWALAASIVMIAVYLIPHSVLGSEIDYTKLPKK